MNNSKNSSLVVALFLLWCNMAISQDNAYDFAAYKFPNVNRVALDFNGFLDGSYSKYDSPTVGLKQYGLRTDFTIRLSTFKNDEKSQKFSSTLLRNYLIIGEEKEIVFSPGLSTTVSSRKYGENLKFLEFGLIANLNYYSSSYNSNQQSKSFRSGTAIPLKLGKGRIDPISNVFLANFIAEDLLEQGVVKYALTQDQLFSLADQIGELNNLRIFDFRKFRVHVIKSLNEWAIKNLDITDEKQIELFTTLTDNWYSSITGTRSNGSVNSFVILPFYDLNKDLQSGISYDNLFGVELFYEFIKQKPASRSFQENTSLQVGIHAGQNKGSFREEKVLRPFIQYGKSFEYYPTSRTNFNVSPTIGLQARFTDYEDTFLDDFSKVTANARCTFGISQQLSMQTRLNAYFNIQYIHSFKETNQNDGNHIYALTTNNNYLYNQGINAPNLYYDTSQKFSTRFNISLSHSFF